MVLMGRLKKAGAEERIWWTQYGFKSKRGTCDDLLLARRVIEQNLNSSRKLMVIALDWVKAFDSTILHELWRRCFVLECLLNLWI